MASPPVAPALVAPEALQRSKKILNSAATFKIQRNPELGLGIGHRVYMNLKHDLNATKNNRQIWHFYRSLLDWVQKRLTLPLIRGAAKVQHRELYLIARAEQAPNPDSRVQLSSKLDALGCRQGNLNWINTQHSNLHVPLAASSAASTTDNYKPCPGLKTAHSNGRLTPP